MNTNAGAGGLYAMSEDILSASLKTLSGLLEKYYGKKVILLIDEYDVPLDKAFQYGYYEEMVSLIPNSIRKCPENQLQSVLCRTHRLSSHFQRKHIHRS